MIMLTCVERVGHEHSVINRCDIDAVALEHFGVVFHVLPDLHDGRIFEQWLDQG